MKRTTRTRAGAQRSAAARRPSAGSGMGGKLLIMAALVAAVVFGVAIFFKVGRIEVQGNTIYASDKIIEASGLELGDNLLTVSRATVGGNVKAALPYVDQVSVGRVLPDTVVISVKESQLAFAAATDTNTVWLISPSGKALERIDASHDGASLAGQKRTAGKDGTGGGVCAGRRRRKVRNLLHHCRACKAGQVHHHDFQ